MLIWGMSHTLQKHEKEKQKSAAPLDKILLTKKPL
jgi:hypothetical protein